MDGNKHRYELQYPSIEIGHAVSPRASAKIALIAQTVQSMPAPRGSTTLFIRHTQVIPSRISTNFWYITGEAAIRRALASFSLAVSGGREAKTINSGASHSSES